MLLTGYKKRIFRPKCNPGFRSVHCIAELGQDIREVLPYLNGELKGDNYTANPPSLTFKLYGKLITIHAREIAVNALRDETEASRIIDWVVGLINETWERRHEIEPCFERPARPQILEILKQLPRTNCHECGQPTCLVFAALVAEGAKPPEACPPLSKAGTEKLYDYLRLFEFKQ